MIDTNFTAVANALHIIHEHPEILKKIPPQERKVLMAALQALQRGYQDSISQRDIDNAARILTAYSDRDTPKSSQLTKIKKGFQNLFRGRVSSAELNRMAHDTERELWLNRGDRFLLRPEQKRDAQRAFEAYKHAFELGSSKAAGRLAWFFETEQFPPKELRTFLEKVTQGNPIIYKMGHLSDEQKVAYYLYEKSAIAGNAIAQRKMGEMWADHPDQATDHLYHPSPNEGIALKWFAKAAKQGDLESKYRAGIIKNRKT